MTQSLNIAIDQDVIDYLNKKKKKILVLDISQSGGGCCPTYEVMDITYKKPEDVALYNASTVEEIEIFITKKAIVAAPVLRFSLENSGLIKHIIAKGLHLKSDR